MSDALRIRGRRFRRAHRRRRSCTRAAGIALLAAILVSSMVLAEPIKSQFRRRPEGVVPPDAERLRGVWPRFHLVRTALAVAAFGLLVTAASYA